MDVKVTELHELQISEEQYANGDRLRHFEAEIDGLLHEEEQYWKQHVWVLWLKEGDKNTNFFHTYVSACQRKNRIVGLLDNEDTWVTSDDGITRIVYEYFSELFSSSCLSFVQLENVLFHLQPKVTEEMNTDLVLFLPVMRLNVPLC